MVRLPPQQYHFSYLEFKISQFMSVDWSTSSLCKRRWSFYWNIWRKIKQTYYHCQSSSVKDVQKSIGCTARNLFLLSGRAVFVCSLSCSKYCGVCGCSDGLIFADASAKIFYRRPVLTFTLFFIVAVVFCSLTWHTKKAAIVLGDCCLWSFPAFWSLLALLVCTWPHKLRRFYRNDFIIFFQNYDCP